MMKLTCRCLLQLILILTKRNSTGKTYGFISKPEKAASAENRKRFGYRVTKTMYKGLPNCAVVNYEQMSMNHRSCHS